MFTTQASPWSYLALCRPRKIFNNSTLNQNISWDTWTQLVPIGNTEDRSGYYVMNDVTVGRRSFCLHTFGIFCEDKMSLIQSECVYFFKCCYTGEGAAPSPDPPSFFEIKFYFKNIKFYHANQCVPRTHKNKYWSEWATFEEYWYALEYKAPLISTSTNFLQPSPSHKCLILLSAAVL